MPATSEQQWKLMKSIVEGNAKIPGLSKEEAEEFISSQPSPKGLPEKKKKRFQKITDKLNSK